MTPTQFVALAFAMRTATHQAHLRTDSFSAHLALQAFYEGIGELADEFAEVWQGLNDERMAKFPAQEVPAKPPLAFLHEYLDTMTQACEQVCDGDVSLENIVAEMRALTARTLYKLKFLGA